MKSSGLTLTTSSKSFNICWMHAKAKDQLKTGMFICGDYWEKQSCYSNQYIKPNCLHPLYVCKNEEGIPEFTFDQKASDCCMSSLPLNKEKGKIG